MSNAKAIYEGLASAGYSRILVASNAPYIWLKTPDKMTSWEFFDYLLEKANIVGTPAQDSVLMVRDSSVSLRLEHKRIHWKQLNELRICKQLPDRDEWDYNFAKFSRIK